MNRNIPHQRRALCAAISLSLVPLVGGGAAFAQQASQESVEEIVVTGSYIRRTEGFTQASSVTQFNVEDLEDEGTLDIGEVVQNLSFVNGADSAITNTIQGTDSRSTEIDLRGLGARSTLTLLDGKRLVNENVNALIPTIAIQRIDIVADGSAALYGNEAVAGVVNFVPFTSYDGLKVQGYAEQDSRGDFDKHSVQLLWGGNAGDVDLVVAGQFVSNSRLGWDERNTLANAGLTFSSNAPGNWVLPNRDENGAYTGPISETANRTNTPDPNCGTASGRTSYKPDEVANPYGMYLGGRSNTCFFDFGDTRSYREPTDITQLFVNASWDYSDDLSFSFQGFHTRHYEFRYSSTSNPGNSRIGELPVVRGEIPGNPFRAVDANGSPLFGQDNDGDGIPDRATDGTDVNGDGVADYIVTGTSDNGVPLYEDVRPRTLRPINKTHTRPSGHTEDMDNTASALDHISRYTFQADFTVPWFDGWEGFAAFTRNHRRLKFMSEQNYDIEAMKDGLNCDVVNARHECYNPFFVVNEADNNTRSVMDAIAARGYEYEEDQMDLIDIVLNGELAPNSIELPGGSIGMAVGYQWRDESYTNTPSPVELAGDTWIGDPNKEQVTSGSRDVDAFFLELSLPLLSNLELETAVRREEFSTGQESTDPKFGITFSPTNWLTLRATQGDAFIAPSLEQLLNPVVCGLATLTDNFGPHEGFTTACEQGNPDLGNETSESQQFGIDIAVGDFDMSLTWNETDFQNRIVDITGQQILDEDFAAFKAATGFEGDGSAGERPSEEQLAAWVANPLSNKDIIRSSDDLTTILQVNGISPINAESVKVEAWDLDSNYRFSTDIGDFSINLKATKIDHFLFKAREDSVEMDGVGLHNSRTGAAPALPEWKANLRINWLNGNHRISSTVHYVDSVEFNGATYSFMDFFGGTFRRKGGIRGVDMDADGAVIEVRGYNGGMIRAWTDMDIAYSYLGLNVLDGEGRLTIGARNVFDREAQHTSLFAGVVGELQDPLGRVIYARFDYEL